MAAKAKEALVELEIGNHYKELEKFKQTTTKEGTLKHQYTCFVRLKASDKHSYKMVDIVDRVEFRPDKNGVRKIMPKAPNARGRRERNTTLLSQIRRRLPASRTDELTWSNIVTSELDIPVKVIFKEGLKIEPLELTYHLNFNFSNHKAGGDCK